MNDYVQKIIPKTTTEGFINLTAKELREKVMIIYKSLYKEKIPIINIMTGILIEFERAGANKTSYGGTIYPKKACLIKILPSIIKHAKLISTGNRKETDNKNVVGYLNFTTNVKVDGEKLLANFSVRIKTYGKFHYSLETN